MLEFCDVPYRFFPARYSPTVSWLAKQINRTLILPGQNHRLQEIELAGEIDKVQSLYEKGKRLLFVANHPSHSDPQLMFEVQRRLGVPSAFMAAYDIFLRGSIQAWVMQKTGAFSIDREGNDRKAMAEAINILKSGGLALTIFPEGNVYLMNDRVTPLLDGTSFIAVKAHQALKGNGEVVVIPLSFKFSQMDDIRPQIWERLEQLAKDCGYEGELDQGAPQKAVLAVGGYMLSHFLGEKTAIKEADIDFTVTSPVEMQDQLFDLSRRLVADLESELEMETDEEVFIVDRVRKVRSRIHQLRLSTESNDEETRDDLAPLADRAILVFRLLAYVLPYLNEHPTLDRYAETVERLCEDFYSKSFKPLGPRKALVRIGEPIEVGSVLAQVGGKSRDAVPELTAAMEKRITTGIDVLNESNETPGSKLLDDLSRG